MTTTSRPESGAPRTSLVLRLLPPGLYAGRGSALMQRSLMVTKTKWLTPLAGFFEPLFYLLSFGSGLGALVGTIVGPSGRPITYAAFIAPAMLAASAMNGAVYDSTFTVYFKLNNAKLYEGMLATSMGPIDIAVGEIGWALSKGAAYSAAFIVAMLVMGLITSPWALLLLPAALLIALAFAAIGMGATTFMSNWQHLRQVQLAILPMFLFSGTFFNLSVYPKPVQWVVQSLPLHHGVNLLRGLSLGVVDWWMLGDVAYFAVMAALGVWLTVTRLERLLLK